MPRKRTSNMRGNSTGHSVKRSRKAITLDVKLDVIRRMEDGEKLCDTAKALGLAPSTVVTIKKNNGKIKASSKCGTSLDATRLSSGRSDLMETMECRLNAWIDGQNLCKIPLSTQIIQKKARSLFVDMRNERGESSQGDTFGASRGWFQGFKKRHSPQFLQQCPAPVITDVGHPVTVTDTDQELGLVTYRDFMAPNSKVAKSVGQPVTLNDTAQVVTVVGSNDNRQISIHPFGATEVCVSGPTVFNSSQEMQSVSEVNQPRRSVKQTDMLTSQVRPSKRSSQAIKEYCKWRRESSGSPAGDQELGLVTDTDSMAPNSKVAKSEANVTPHAVLQEDMIFPQSKTAATQKEKQTLAVPNHQVAVMSNLLLMWKAGQLCDFYISNGSTNIMVHKMVLGAVCPEVLPVLHSTSSSSFPKMTFPSSISKEGLLAFAEYMYGGVLDLNQDILVQLKTIAQRLDMNDFEKLCSSELHKAKAASILSAVVNPLLTEPCSLSGLLPSSTQRTPDSRFFPNTTLSPLLKLLENINSSNSSNSQGVVPTGNLATVGGPSSSSYFPTLRSALGTTTAGQVIDIKTELESDDETILTQNSQQLRMKPCNPISDQHYIQEELLIDFNNIAPNTGVGLQLASPAGSSSTSRGVGLPVSYSTNHYRCQSNPTSPEIIHVTDLRHFKDNQLLRSNRRGGENSSNNNGDGGNLQLVPITSVSNNRSIPTYIEVNADTNCLSSL